MSIKITIASAINLPSLPKFNSSATIAETSKIFAVTKSKIACNLPSEDKALIEKMPLIASMKSFEPSSVTNWFQFISFSNNTKSTKPKLINVSIDSKIVVISWAISAYES